MVSHQPGPIQAFDLGSRRARACSSADDRSDLIDSTILSPNKQQEKRITPPRLRVFTSESDHRRAGIIQGQPDRDEFQHYRARIP